MQMLKVPRDQHYDVVTGHCSLEWVNFQKKKCIPNKNVLPTGQNLLGILEHFSSSSATIFYLLTCVSYSHLKVIVWSLAESIIGLISKLGMVWIYMN